MVPDVRKGPNRRLGAYLGTERICGAFYRAEPPDDFVKPSFDGFPFFSGACLYRESFLMSAHVLFAAAAHKRSAAGGDPDELHARVDGLEHLGGQV